MSILHQPQDHSKYLSQNSNQWRGEAEDCTDREISRTREFMEKVQTSSLTGETLNFAEYGCYGILIKSIFENYQQGGVEAALKTRDTFVHATPQLAEVLVCSKNPGLHPWFNQIRTLKDAYAPRPPLEYVVAGLFPIPSLSIVYGAPGSLKSMLLADMAVCVAAGLPWLSPLTEAGAIIAGRKTTPSFVLWIDFDNGMRKTAERMEALAKARHLPVEIPFKYVSMPTPWLDASHAQEVDNLTALVKQCNVKLLIIDNLNTISGNVDENSAAMGTIMSHLRRLAEDSKVAVVVIHHQRKGNGEKGHIGDTLRGHSSINAALDLALKVDRAPNSDAVAIECTKARGETVQPFKAHFAYSKKPDGELQTAQFYGLPAEANTSDIGVRKAVLEIVKEYGEIRSKETLKELVRNGFPNVVQQSGM